jgi:hypothetical protein
VQHPSVPAVLVDYYRTGGIAGFNDRLVIFDNGVTVVSGKTINQEIEMNRTDIDRIVALFNQSSFSTLEQSYSARPGSADLIHYTISYQNNGGPRIQRYPLHYGYRSTRRMRSVTRFALQICRGNGVGICFTFNRHFLSYFVLWILIILNLKMRDMTKESWFLHRSTSSAIALRSTLCLPMADTDLRQVNLD